jgi:hypothetical protein
MIHLLRGDESKEKIDLLVSLTSITSEKTIGAFYSYYVDGRTDSQSVEVNGVTASNFSRDIKKLNEVARKCELYKLFK